MRCSVRGQYRVQRTVHLMQRTNNVQRGWDRSECLRTGLENADVQHVQRWHLAQLARTSQSGGLLKLRSDSTFPQSLRGSACSHAVCLHCAASHRSSTRFASSCVPAPLALCAAEARRALHCTRWHDQLGLLAPKTPQHGAPSDPQWLLLGHAPSRVQASPRPRPAEVHRLKTPV